MSVTRTWIRCFVFVLLVVTFPTAVAGQRGPFEPEPQGFLEQRLHDPSRFPRLDRDAAASAVTLVPQSLALWQVEVVRPGTGTNTLAVDVDAMGHPHVIYYGAAADPTRVQLTHSTHDGIAWRAEATVSWPAVASETRVSMALDHAGRPHLSYCLPTRDFLPKCEQLKYAYSSGGVWYVEDVDDFASRYHALRLDAAGRPHIAYYKESGGDLGYAYRDSSGWHTQIVDSAGNVGSNLDLAIASNGLPHISYCSDPLSYGTDCDGGACNSLKYASYDGSRWLIQTVDGGGFVGNSTSVVVDGAGRPHISYVACGRDYTLRYATFNGATWGIQSLDAAAGQTSLNLDSAGRPHIAYDGSNDGHRSLMYASFDGYGWRRSVVAPLPVWSPPPYVPISSAINTSTSQPIIGYWGEDDVRLATQLTDMGAWTRLTYASYRDMNWEIYTAEGSGTGVTRRTNNEALDSLPKLNRGATRVVFVSQRDGNAEIYAMNRTGSDVTRLTWTAAEESTPSWSPDGSRVVFASNRDGNWEIYAMQADGANPVRLTHAPDWDGHPDWSPDGTKVVYSSLRNGRYELWVMNADGSNQRQLFAGLATAVYPAWSPDGTRIAFNGDPNGDGWLDVAIINADGTGLSYPVGSSPAAYDYLAPAWAPTGTGLAFTRVQWIAYQGAWYWVDAYVMGYDLDRQMSYSLRSSGYEWWVDWQGTDISAPTSMVAPLPQWSGESFWVHWLGSDSGGSGICATDVQYRDGADGPWVHWLTNTRDKSALFTGQKDHTFYFRSRARDCAMNVEAYPASSDTLTTVDVTAPASQTFSPENAPAPTFTVTWSGFDAGSGIASYDIQYREGPAGVWVDWLTGTDTSSALFAGELQRSYTFRSRARDQAGNLEAYPEEGDSQTQTPAYQLTGQVVNNRHAPIFNASVEAQPPVLNTPRTDGRGNYALTFNTPSTNTLIISRTGFAALPPFYGAVLGAGAPALDFVLGPAEDGIENGGWELGDLRGWHPGEGITATASPVAAHTGHFGLRLETSSAMTASVIAITQSVSVPAGWSQPTLSWLYRPIQGGHDAGFDVVVTGAGTAITATLSMTPTQSWHHAWLDLSAFAGHRVTVSMRLNPGAGWQALYVDEVSLGPSRVGSYQIHGPLLMRKNQ